jgi:ParB family chromosome partitioning protein
MIPDTPQPADLLMERLLEDRLRKARREALGPIEQARAFRTVMDARGWSARELARSLSITRSIVDRALSLLDLPESVQVQVQVEQGALAPASADEVAKLHDPAAQAAMAALAVAEGLTRAEVAESVHAVKAKRPAPAARPEPAAFDLGDGVVVTIRWKKACPVGAAQALKKSLKVVQARGNPEQAA